MGRTRLFVYGSLKRGCRHHGELGGARFVRSASTAPGYDLVMAGDYPALVPGQGVVHGELYSVPPEDLERLDAFESVPTLYQRTEILLEDGSTAQAYTMTARAVVGLGRLPGGDFRE